MKKSLLFLVQVAFIAYFASAQALPSFPDPYEFNKYETHSFPDPSIAEESDFDTQREISVYIDDFDMVNTTTPVLTEDIGQTIGLTGSSGDTGGGAIRGYDYTGNDHPELKSNGGWKGWRQPGQWARYSIDFTETGIYNIYVRVRGVGASHSVNVYLNRKSDSGQIFSSNTVSSTQISTIGTGGPASQWLKLDEQVSVENIGDYVVTLEHVSGDTWGEFTVVKAGELPLESNVVPISLWAVISAFTMIGGVGFFRRKRKKK